MRAGPPKQACGRQPGWIRPITTNVATGTLSPLNTNSSSPKKGGGKAWGAQIQSPEEKFALKRQAVLRTAASLFRRKGVENTTLGDVAGELNVSKPTVYYYFRNKDDVVIALIEAAVADFCDPDRHPQDYPLAPGLSCSEQFERFVRRCLRILLGELGESFPLWLPNLLEGEKRAQFIAAGKPVDDMAEAILQTGMREGVFASCDSGAVYRFVLGALLYIPVWQKDRKTPSDAIADAFVAFAMRSIRRV